MPTNPMPPDGPKTDDAGPGGIVPPAVPEADLKAVAEGNNAFVFELYRKLAEDKANAGNIVFSPYSIRTALAMTYAGAKGPTAAEMRDVLHFTLPDERLHTAIAGSAHAMTPVGANPAYRLSVANALWGQVGMPFVPEFLALTNRVYGGGFRELDFGRDPDAARKTINLWVSDKTERRIPELLQKGGIRANTVLVLTNAIYFQGEWETRFPTAATRDADFEVRPGERVRLPLMHAVGEFRYAVTPVLRAVELPYRGGRLSMV
ncbi:MAG: serpin family protein, partial [Gemmataceae bacterium]